jgi:hypothetical protein
MSRIYVASSWRNETQPDVVKCLQLEGHDVYDFKNPAPGNHGFHWSEIDPDWKRWSCERFRSSIDHPIAVEGFASDMKALMSCEACVLVLPCGRSAHLELGWAVGAKKRTCILLQDSRDTRGHSMSVRACSVCGDLDGCHLPAKPEMEPELMYKMVDKLALSIVEVVEWLRK